MFSLSYSCRYKIHSNDRDQEEGSKEVCIIVTIIGEIRKTGW